MARIFVTGSGDGLGQLAAMALIKQGHQVVIHARNERRAQEAKIKVPGAEACLISDLSAMEETRELAKVVNQMGGFDAIIHNAGVYQVPRHEVSIDGLPLILAVNTIAPYILTCLIHPPKRLIYLSSGMHLHGDPSLKGLLGNEPNINYSDSKLHDLILSKAVARKWDNVHSNAVDPGWVPTKMGGAAAPDVLEKGFETQVWLAVSNEASALVNGVYFHHKRPGKYLIDADDAKVQDQFLSICEKISGVSFPNTTV
jgi:NAD(P)-dependent dehydrogenase (short-subunit alcohol dehydrogenase family)